MTDFNAMTDREKEAFHVRQLCRRLLDIDTTCDANKGCPAHFVAFPMIDSFRERGWGDANRSEYPVIRRMLSADSQGRVCEIEEIQYIARTFLENGEGME